MYRSGLGFVLLCCLLAACKNGDKEKTKGSESNSTTPGMSALFKETSLPYQLSDTFLLKNSDTTTINSTTISPLIADSLKTKYFGKNAVVKYTPLAKFIQKEKESYYVVKASAGNKKAAVILVFDNLNNFGASYPFLLPDADPQTSQVSFLDKNFTVTKTITQRNGTGTTGEGKEVVAYDAAKKGFSLIMMDLLDDDLTENINPIDTFPKTHKLAGDYILNKKNIVSVRDGRYPNQLLVYIRTENNAGDCKGEFKGEFLVTSSTTAAYRQGGDPCVLGLTFSGNKVSIREEQGCGNYRGLDCPLTGTFTRKKPATKDPVKKTNAK